MDIHNGWAYNSEFAKVFYFQVKNGRAYLYAISFCFTSNFHAIIVASVSNRLVLFTLTRHLSGWLVCWVVGWLVDWVVGWLVGWLVSWLVGWLVGWFVGLLVGWLVG